MKAPGSEETLRQKAKVLGALRHWFSSNGYLEIQTPVVVPSPAMESNLYAYEAAGGFLRTSPEFALKKVAAQQLGRIYEIGPCFRAKEAGTWHSPEFTMVEWYRAGATLVDLMGDVEALVRHTAHVLQKPSPEQWTRVSVSDLFFDVLGIDIKTASTETLSATDSDWNDAFYRRWVEDIEPTILAPTFVYDWPASQAALASVRTDNSWPVAQRFEAYLGGIELANAYLELTDSTEQKKRFKSENLQRESRNDPPHPIDEELCTAVGHMPVTSGIALGFDRLVALLCDWSGLR